MAAMFLAVIVVLRTRPRAIPPAMITMRKSIHGFPFLSYMSMVLGLGPLGRQRSTIKKSGCKGCLRIKLAADLSHEKRYLQKTCPEIQCGKMYHAAFCACLVQVLMQAAVVKRMVNYNKVGDDVVRLISLYLGKHGHAPFNKTPPPPSCMFRGFLAYILSGVII